MDFYFIIGFFAIILMGVLGYFMGNRGKKEYVETISKMENKAAELTNKLAEKVDIITNLTAEREFQRANAENLRNQLEEQRRDFDTQMEKLEEDSNERIAELKSSYEQQIKQVKEATEGQIEALKEMNQEQVKSQLDLIREQMQSTSEKVLKTRQEELGEQNKEQVSKIIDPLQNSLKQMEEALERAKTQQNEALVRLDETIKKNMERSADIGEKAERLANALTGEVKVQGNFGELKLKQLLENLELKEGEQYDTQETLKDKYGKRIKGNDDKGMIPDFILHFPNNRHVVVDSKMSLTDYERYMNDEDGSPDKTIHLKAHIDSVRAQVKRLAKKDYTQYLPEGCNRLNFAIMYIPIEGALNLALLNDASLWREAYNQDVMILGPQTMYMNLRVLEMMWTQVRQLKNQQAIMDAANTVIERVQDFGKRFMDVESSMSTTIEKMNQLKKSTADGGQSIITAAKNLLKAGARESKKKKSLKEITDSIFIDSDQTQLLSSDSSIELEDTNEEA